MQQPYPTAWNRNNDTGYFGAARYRINDAVIKSIPVTQPSPAGFLDQLGSPADLQKLIQLAAKIVIEGKGVTDKPELLPEINESPEMTEVRKELRRLVSIDKKAQAAMLKRISTIDKKLEEFDQLELEIALTKLRQLGR